MQVPSKWTEPFDPIRKEEFKRLLYADKEILGRLYAIIEEFEKSLDQKELSIEEYQNAAFPYLKADRIGERRGLNKIKQLLQFVVE